MVTLLNTNTRRGRTKYGIFVMMTLGGTYACLRCLRRRDLAKNRQKWISVGKDVVVLHGFPRGKTCLSLSPFPLKLETYLRMNNIKYVTEFKHFIGPKGKTPWITINGVDIADSQLALEYLAQHFQIDMSHYLDKEERAIERSMRILMEDHLYWWAVIEKVCADEYNMYKMICFSSNFYL